MAFGELQDVILYTLPRRIDSLKGVLQQATGMMRCYPVFAELRAG